MCTKQIPATGPILVLLCITAVLSHSAAAWAITVYPPSVFPHGRAIHVIPVWTGLTREALPDPNNPTSANIMQFAFAVEDLDGVNGYSGGIPDAACGPDGTWASFYPEVGNACYPVYQPQVGLPTDGCYCIYNTGTVNLKAPTAYAVPVFEVTGLGSGRHTLNVKAAGKGHIFVNAAEVIR